MAKVSRAISRKDNQEVRKARKTFSQGVLVLTRKTSDPPQSLITCVFTFNDSVPQERMMPCVMKQNIHLVQALDSSEGEIR